MGLLKGIYDRLVERCLHAGHSKEFIECYSDGLWKFLQFPSIKDGSGESLRSVIELMTGLRNEYRWFFKPEYKSFQEKLARWTKKREERVLQDQ